MSSFTAAMSIASSVRDEMQETRKQMMDAFARRPRD
jgi:Tfp pilus assembly protein FimV